MAVLVPYDGSEQSQCALDAAVKTFPDREITLLHVLEPFADYSETGGETGVRYEQLEANAKALLADAVETLPPETTVETIVRHGRPIHEIVRIAEDGEYSHIVIGSRGRDGATRLLLGSVAETVVRRSPVPVTVVREQSHICTPEHVLVPFDGSAESKSALVSAIEQYPDAEITALYVRYPKSEETSLTSRATPDVIDEGVDSTNERPDEIDEQTASVCSMAERTATDAGGSIRTESTDGDPAREIIEFARETTADHIVMGSHGRDGLTRLLLGSVAETVVRRSPTAVTVVR